MKLLAYLINEQMVGVDIDSWDHADLGGNPAFKKSETVDAGYGEVTGIENIYKLNANADFDYKAGRALIKEKVIAIAGADFADWDSLSQAEKEIASELFIVPKVKRDTVHSLDEQIANGINFHKKSTECRQDRMFIAMSEIYNRVDDNSCCCEICDDMSEPMSGTGDLKHLFTEAGREGTEEGDSEGMFDYIEGRVGTVFEGVGFKDKDFTVIGMANMEELSDKLIDIMKHGKY